jgi:hypothetical protein
VSEEHQVEVAVWVHIEMLGDPDVERATYQVVVVTEELRGRRGTVVSRPECDCFGLPVDVAGCYREALAWVPAGAVAYAPNVRSVGVPAGVLARVCDELEAAAEAAWCEREVWRE